MTVASYTDRVQPVTWRGVTFDALDCDLSGGRRGTVEEYPGQDTAAAVDLGMRSRSVQITAVFSGPDWDADAAALLGALDEPGPAEFIHPIHGRLLCVHVGEYSERMSSSAGNRLEISFTLREVGDLADLRDTVNLDPVDLRAAAAATEAGDALADSLPAALTGPVPIGQARRAVGDWTAHVREVLRVPGYALDRLSEVLAALDDLEGDAAALVLTPLVLYDRIRATLADVADTGALLAIAGDAYAARTSDDPTTQAAYDADAAIWRAASRAALCPPILP